MANNDLYLLCLVDGLPSSRAFEVEVDRTRTIAHLKDRIKTKQTPAFDDITVDQLTLWRVSIPSNMGSSRITIDALDDKTELNEPGKRLFLVFSKPPDDNTYILVQRPPPVHTPAPVRSRDPSRSTSPAQLISVRQDYIEPELEIILNGVQHHYANHSIDPKELKMSQLDTLELFFKSTLPYDQSPRDINLVMLGLRLDKQARTTTEETLPSIVEGDIDKSRGFRVVAMVAPSGSGKTATIVDLATKHFVIYCVCSTPRATVSADFNDLNFIKLATDIENIYATFIRTQGVSHNPVEIDFEIKRLASERVELEFLARMLFLQLLLNNNPDLEPWQFFREQTTTGGATIGTLVYKLREYNTLTIQAMLLCIQTKLHLFLVPRRLGLVIAVDEAQVAANDILANKLISPSALIDTQDNNDALFDAKKQIQLKYRRGFLTPLSASLSSLKATLVMLGTSLSLQNADHVYSALDKTSNFTRITDFPRLDESDVMKLLSDLIDLSGCEIPPAKRRKLSGRPRFPLGIIKRLIAGPIQISKQATLDCAVDRTIEDVKRGLRDGVRTILESDKTGESSRLLCRMVLANYLHGGKISFSSSKQSDFVNKALCRLRQDPDDVHLIMDEPIVVEAVEEELKASGKDSAFSEYLDQLYQIVTNFGVASTSKGDALEPLVRRSLQRFNGLRLVDLPFLQGIALPKWCDDLKLQIDGINTANGFGYTDRGITSDLAFLTERPPNKMLIARYGTRPDGAWFFSDKRYAGSLAIKFYSSSVSQKMHKENETSSDVRACFLKVDGITVNKALADTRRAYVNTGIPSSLKGILRIHLEFPDVQYGMPATHVSTNPVTGDQDVMVYINLSNMDDFFFEGISEHKDDMVRLKKIIRLVCQK